jgi:hypothetical protein
MSDDNQPADRPEPFLVQQPPRVRPLAPKLEDLPDKGVTISSLYHAAFTWGQGINFQNNLIKTMAHCPRIAQTEVEYANSFIFDEGYYRNGVQQAGFIDRFLKEIIITCVALENNAPYSVTHHTFISFTTFAGAGRAAEYVPKFVDLHLPLAEFEAKYGGGGPPYEAIEYALIRYTKKVCHTPHQITDDEVAELRGLLEAYNVGRGGEPWGGPAINSMERLVDSQLVEITWTAAHFCLLGRWFTALRVADEAEGDEVNFSALYAQTVPAEIIRRNNELLARAYK